MNEETTNPRTTESELPEDTKNTQDQAGAETGAQAEPEEKSPETPQAPPPAGTTTPQALFDLAPKKKEEPKKAATGNPAGAKAGTETSARPEPQKYAEGTEVRYGRERVVLPKEMTAQEVLAWMGEDDYPELKYEEVEVRHDKEKNRLVIVRKAQKKGSGCGPAGAEAPAAR